MIELISGFPANILGVRAVGHVTAADYESVLIPAVNAFLKRHDKVRLYYELGEGFDGIDVGAFLDDLKIGIAKLRHWEKVAIVTDVGWIVKAVSIFATFIPGMVRVFPVTETGRAKDWIEAS